jgi:hypothetical protein
MSARKWGLRILIHRGRKTKREILKTYLNLFLCALCGKMIRKICEICGYYSCFLSEISWPNLNTIAKRFLNFVPLCLCNFAPLQPYNFNNSCLSCPSWFKQTAKKRKTPLTGQKAMIPKKQEKSKQSHFKKNNRNNGNLITS